MDTALLKSELIAEASRLGFAAAGVTSVRPFGQARIRALRAITDGRMDGMPWYSRDRVEAASDLRKKHPWARSVLALAWAYSPALTPRGPAPEAAAPPGRPRGRISAYACIEVEGRAVDYHSMLASRCDDLIAWLRGRDPGLQAKRFVDHGWAMDRPVAERAGVGFAGKHASLITREAGSYVLLAEVLLSIPLAADVPSSRGCGTCRACLPACPTGAITAPGVIDSRRCISYLTIEHRGPIPLPLRPLMGTWAFGCDLCQEACPINERLAPTARDAGAASTAHGPVPFPDLVECLELSEAEFATRFRGTAVWRTGRAGLARNCAIALGNAGDSVALAALRRARESDPDAVVRESAAWAIARLQTSRS
ncbi:MAG TPA: tRNA epoxyqueuosine(34) reductase QueG [Candidatus Acidoferrales bacterium]|nr:tRNA epoxyqueuosine(34) reductase QueG [Candidatus Acidoferrales bacterium]